MHAAEVPPSATFPHAVHISIGETEVRSMKRIALAILLALVAFSGATTMAWADGDMSDVATDEAP
jgi:hypothetical protein